MRIFNLLLCIFRRFYELKSMHIFNGLNFYKHNNLKSTCSSNTHNIIQEKTHGLE